MSTRHIALLTYLQAIKNSNDDDNHIDSAAKAKSAKNVKRQTNIWCMDLWEGMRGTTQTVAAENKLQYIY